MRKGFPVALSILSALLLLLSASKAYSKDTPLCDKIVEEAMKCLGKPYRAGGKGPDCFDCSGFTRFVYSKVGIDIPAGSYNQAELGRGIDLDYSKFQKGDLLIFSGRSSREVGHVGMYVGPAKDGEGFLFIHAATSNGIRISNISEDYYDKRLQSVRRILPDVEPVSDDPVEFDRDAFLSDLLK